MDEKRIDVGMTREETAWIIERAITKGLLVIALREGKVCAYSETGSISIFCYGLAQFMLHVNTSPYILECCIYRLNPRPISDLPIDHSDAINFAPQAVILPS